MTSSQLVQTFVAPRLSRAAAVETLFRLGIASCYIGHGAFGIITKEAWLPYFGLVGIAPDAAYALMPVIGAVDIVVGVVGLVSPRRIILVYMSVWAIWTALLRPLTGESGWEFFERAGNYGVPLAFLAAVGVGGSRSWFSRIRIDSLATVDLRRVTLILHVATVMLLLGHGVLAVTGANGLVLRHLAAIGVSPELATVLGGVEIGVAIALAFHASPSLLLAVAAWKIATELLFPVAGAPWWEVVERGGSYTAPVLLALLIPLSAPDRRPRSTQT